MRSHLWRSGVIHGSCSDIWYNSCRKFCPAYAPRRSRISLGIAASASAVLCVARESVNPCDRHVHDNLEVVCGDVRDPNYCREITKDIDVVFHLAALIAIPYSYVAPNILLKILKPA